MNAELVNHKEEAALRGHLPFYVGQCVGWSE